MAQIDHKHPTMTLYVERNSPITYWICGVLAEKTIEPNLIFINPKKKPADFEKVNPKGILPLLTDQEGLILYTPSIIVEYLEERFPHPPLLPIYPIMRAKCRQVMQQVEKGWYGLLQQIQKDPKAKEPIHLLEQRLISFAPLFDFKTYFLSDQVTLVDCCIMSALWSLKKLNISLASDNIAVQDYQKRLLAREAFQNVLSKLEVDID